ncbi:iron-containing redox enzyme family protein [Candidatus Parcubacteria bacterium]|nr:iron-containing redox enzyme family protein [Candidatus Parcubacteria bacterium]
MARVIQDSPDPAWLTNLDEECKPYLKALHQLPVVRAAIAYQLELAAMHRFMLQIGRGIIEPFPGWLNSMLLRTTTGTLQARFLYGNQEEEEREHWQWWQEMAEAFGVNPGEYQTIVLSNEVGGFSELLTFLSAHAPLAAAMTAVNYVVETAAAHITAAVAPKLYQQLGGYAAPAARWLRAHAEGDPDHSADARELVKGLVGYEWNLQCACARAARMTYQLFTAALDDAYR